MVKAKKEVKVNIKKEVIKKEAKSKSKQIPKSKIKVAQKKVERIVSEKFEKDDLMNLLSTELHKVKEIETRNKREDEMALLHTGFSNQKDIDFSTKQKQASVDKAIAKDEFLKILSKRFNVSSTELQQKYKIYTYLDTGHAIDFPETTLYPISYFFYNHLTRTIKDYPLDSRNIILSTNDAFKFIYLEFDKATINNLAHFFNSRDSQKYKDNKDLYLHEKNINKSEIMFSNILKNCGTTIKTI